ncbi:MAG: hypothetical protein K0S38_314 [Candidatus Paceibacter sp.]|jgi:hypothetical protein|nr:hypothetical protein [Candidatus Paceibacter sp.]
MENQTIERSRSTAGDFFLQLGIIVALYISSISLVGLLFQIINKAFPDKLNPYYYYNNESVLWFTAFLIIMFPLYLLLGWFYNKQLGQNPEKLQLTIRKWLVYLTLFLAGLALAIDLVTLVFYFLNGEITIRFILKVLSVLVVAGMIFGYYITDIRKGVEAHAKTFKTYAWIAIALVVVSIVVSFVVVGTPVNQRKVRFDDRRVSDLQGIQWQVISYWQTKEKLPASLADLANPIENYSVPVDPETGVPYTYQATGTTTFKLCATFALPSQNDSNGRSIAMPVYPDEGTAKDSWKHEAGNQCFERTIDPDRYPIYEKPMMR